MAQILRIEVFRRQYDDFDLSYEEFIAWLKENYESVDPENRPDVRIQYEFDRGYDCDSMASFTMYYDRFETPDDVAAREAEYLAALQRCEQYEREQYERLKAKFG